MDAAVELLRKLNNVIRIGTIADVDVAKARARVADGDLLTDWRPWLALRAGSTRTWNPPTVGEQALLLSAGGDPADSLILVGIYSDAQTAPDDTPDLDKTVYPDGAVIEYDHNQHHLRADIPGSAKLTAKTSLTADAGADVTVTTKANMSLQAAGNINITATGNVAVSGARIDLN